MPSPLDTSERESYLPLLWDAFLNKIDDEWEEKHQHLGNDRHSIKSNALLANDLSKDLRATTESDQASPAISVKLIKKYLDQDGLPIKIKATYLVQLLRYCDFTDWKNFVKSVIADDPGTTDKNKNDNSFRNPWFHLGPVILLLISLAVTGLPRVL